MRQILKMISELPKKIMNKIIDEETKRVNAFNSHIFDTGLKKEKSK